MKRTKSLSLLMGVCVVSLASSSLMAAVPVGSIALYSNGQVEKLISADGDEFLWEDDRKRLYLRSANPVTPVLMRRNFLSGRGYRQTVMNGQPDSILSLPPGTPVEFTVLRTKTDGEQLRRTWKCVRSKTRTAQVMRVERRIDDFTCERFIIHRKFWHPVVKERREFSFSPDLGLVTKMKRIRGEKTMRWELVKLIEPQNVNYKHVSRQVRKLRAPKQRRDEK